jgi:sialate O-acetylesterase
MSRLLLLTLLCASMGAAQSVRVTSGAVDDQVFQRTGAGADIALAGAAQGKAIEARILRKHEPVRDWAQLATVSGGAWKGVLSAVPTGGPYRIELRVAGANEAGAVIQNVLVGDLWVLAGQSNMEGVGDLVNTPLPSEMVHNFDLSDRWAIAEDPLHNLPGAVDRVHWRKNAQGEVRRLEGAALAQFIANRKKGAGLGLPFGLEMARRTGVPVGLVSCAHGGTSMAQWDPALKDKGGDSLYGAMLRRVRLVGGKVTGVLWYQGESDANPKAAPLFQNKFEQFVKAVRDDLLSPGLPFYYVQIGRHASAASFVEWNSVQESQRLAETTIPRSGMVAAIDFSLDDGIHVSTPDHTRLGRRLANLACHDLFADKAGCGAYRRGPRPVSAKYAAGEIRVQYEQVNGSLTSEGRIAGFSIHGPDGAPIAGLFKARVAADDASTVVLSFGGKLPAGATLRYGVGRDPYCNLRDSADMAAPVFGPMPITQEGFRIE